MNGKLKFLFFIFLLHSYTLHAQLATYSNDFLSIGAGARAMAMGNASVASTNGFSAGYWNPAGLLFSDKNVDFGLLHAAYFSNMANYDYFSASYKATDSLSFGFSLIRLGIDNIPNTLDLLDSQGNLDYDRVHYFSVADYALFFSIAKQTSIPHLSIGGNIKFIYRHQGEFANAYGFGMDAALLFVQKKLHVGIMLRDALGTFNAWMFDASAFNDAFIATGNDLPTNSLEISLPSVSVGIAYRITLNDKFSILPELNSKITIDGKRNVLYTAKPLSIDPFFGMELSYKKMISLRAGINNVQRVIDFDQSERWTVQPNIGLGLRFFGFSIDYALTGFGEESELSNIFSLAYAFDYKPQKGLRSI